MSLCWWLLCEAVQVHCSQSVDPGSGDSSMLVHGKAQLLAWQ